jgi:hypothetical protein
MKVPTYPVGGSVEPAARGPVYQSSNGAATLDAFGSNGAGMDALSRRLDRVSDQATTEGLRVIQEENERQAKQLDLEASKRLRELNYGDGTDQNPGFLSRKGEDALNNAKDTRDAVAKIRNDVLGMTQNPRVRQLAQDIIDRRAESELVRVDSHISEQRKAFAATVSEARIEQARSDAAASWNDPEVLKRSLGIAAGEIISMKDQRGWSDEVAAQKLSEARGAIISSTVKQAIASDNVQQAQQILDANEKGLPAAARVELYTALRNASVDKQGQAIADTMWAKFGGNATAAYEYLKGVASGKVRDEAWSQWEKVSNAARTQVTRAREDANYKREEEKRNDPVIGDAAQRAWTEYSRTHQQQEAERNTRDREERTVAVGARDEWVRAILAGNGAPDLKAMSEDVRLDKYPEWKAELRNFAVAATREEPPAAVSRRAWTDLAARINLPYGDPNKITDMQPIIREAGSLTKADRDDLFKMVQDGADPDKGRLGQSMKVFTDRVKARITGTIAGDIDKRGEADFYEFEQYVLKRVRDLQAEKKDPFVLFNPSSPEYLGAPGVLAGFQRSLQDQSRNIQEDLGKGGLGGNLSGGLPRVTRDAAGVATFNKLKSGQRFMDEKGEVRVKP